jgi:hypothetical protein
MDSIKLNNTVKQVTDLLALESYEKLEKLSNGSRLSAIEMEQAITEYGKTILPLPIPGYEKIDVFEVISSNPRKWSVNVPVYTREEGESDLTLELTLIDTSNEIYGIEVDDIHVL